jgi:hypothetical protein
MNAVLLLKDKEGTGSAVIVSPDGVVLTAAHVVGEKEEIGALTQSGEELTLKVVRTHPFYDVAVLQVLDGPEQLPCLPLAEGTATLGTSAYVLGSPAGEELSFSVSRGIVSGKRQIDGRRFLQTDASVNPGNSGGPLVNEQGEVMGIVSWKVAATEYEGLSFAVPSMGALSFLNLQIAEQTDLSEPGQRVADGAAMSSGGSDPDYLRGLEAGRQAAKELPWLKPVGLGAATGCGAGCLLGVCGAPVVCLAPAAVLLPVQEAPPPEEADNEAFVAGYEVGYQGAARGRQTAYAAAGLLGGAVTGAAVGMAAGLAYGAFAL